MNRRQTLAYPKTSDSTDSNEPIPTLDSLEKEYCHEEEAPGSPHSYLSMPSCKDFPDMSSVEPLCRVLEPIKVFFPSILLHLISVLLLINFNFLGKTFGFGRPRFTKW